MTPQAPAWAGLRHSRWRGGVMVVGIYDGKAADMDTTAGRWQTVCEVHGSIISHRTLRGIMP